MEGLESLTVGALFHGRYRVVRRLKSGGMGAVYEVLDEKTDKQRALKVMLPSALEDPDFRARFEREARVTGSIESDHIVHVSDAGIDDATSIPFLVMELLRGEELAGLLRRAGPLPPADVLTYLSQAALGLDKTHAAGIVHRDLKPENLFLTRADDGSPRVKILDFGIAKVLAPDGSSNTTRALGTPKYMAPEQVRSEKTIGPRTDIYALGQVAYALLAGEHYWSADAADAGDSLFNLLMKIVAGADESASARAMRRRKVTLPAGFDAWFFRATAVDPEDRFDRASTAVAALAQALDLPVLASLTASVTPGALAALPPASARTPAAAEPLSVHTTTPTDHVSVDVEIEPGATGKNWGATVGGPRPRRRARLLAVGAALALVSAAAVWLAFGRAPAADGPPPVTAASASPTAPAAQVTAPRVEPQAIASGEPAASIGPTASAKAAASAEPAATGAPGTSKRGSGKATGAATPGAASAPAPTASAAAKPPSSSVIDPWGTKPKSTAAPAASTKPGMF
jgi:tRNA A-37 threonylcarbamoyl transferase component Bud32